MIGVYVIRNRNTERAYVGSSKDIKNRWRRHKYDLNAGRHHSKKLQRGWNKHGADAFHFFVLMECAESELLKCEQDAINALQPFYNDCLLAGRPLGRKHTAEARAKMAQSHTGKKLSVSHRMSMAKAQTGRVVSAETRTKLSATHKRIGSGFTPEQMAKAHAASRGNKYSLGRVVSDETRQKISAVQKGVPKKPFTPEHRAAISRAAKERYARIGQPIKKPKLEEK